MTRRRDFIKTSLLATGFLGLQRAIGASAPGNRLATGYGPLLSDPRGLMDLPKGFSYQVISRRGTRMSDGYKVPGQPDGMAAFPGRDGRVVLVRNHELALGSASWGPLDDVKSCPVGVPCYDEGTENEIVCPGGTTHLIFDPKSGRVEEEFLSLFGTDRNCAGGPTPWGSWITCEEPEFLTEGRGSQHGWCFEVDASAKGVQKPIPIKEMGRFRHEAVAVDPKTGIVYLTEDRFEGLFYRFVPKVKGKLAEGGQLQALAITGMRSADSRNWSPQWNLAENKKVAVEWIDMEDVESPKDDLRFRGAEAGATLFARGEGCWWHEEELFFCCTNGGRARRGQLFRFKPSGNGGELELFLEPSQSDLLTNGDNLTLARNGDVIIAEDRADDQCSLRGVTPGGRIYTLATNVLNSSELAGVCFSPDGDILFVNLQTPGLTLAIRGDWSRRVG